MCLSFVIRLNFCLGQSLFSIPGTLFIAVIIGLTGLAASQDEGNYTGFRDRKSKKPSYISRAWAVSGTGVGRAAFHCYPVLKVVMSAIPFS